jgi:hypothetical protein
MQLEGNMTDFVIGDVALPVSGERDGRGETALCRLYWLDAEGRVLATTADREGPLAGEDFFAALGTVAGERTVFLRGLDRGVSTPYLAQCGDTPVLLLRAPYRGNLTVLACVPLGEAVGALRNLSLYHGVLGLPVELSPLSVAVRGSEDEREFLLLREWLHRVAAMTAKPLSRTAHTADLSAALKLRASALAKECGCLVEYDVSGLGFGDAVGVDDPLLSASLAALFFLTREYAADRLLHLTLYRDAERRPVLHARLYADAEAASAVLASLTGAYRVRGNTVQVYPDTGREGLLHVVLPFGATEISLQQLLNKFL